MNEQQLLFLIQVACFLGGIAFGIMFERYWYKPKIQQRTIKGIKEEK